VNFHNAALAHGLRGVPLVYGADLNVYGFFLLSGMLMYVSISKIHYQCIVKNFDEFDDNNNSSSNNKEENDDIASRNENEEEEMEQA